MTKLAESRVMYQMRMEGMSYQEIANHYGVSRQDAYTRVKGYESKLCGNRGWGFSINKIVYKGIYEYFRDNLDVSVSKFTNMILGYIPTDKHIGDFLMGKSETTFKIKHIKRMCELTGKTFEELFELREGVKIDE